MTSAVAPSAASAPRLRLDRRSPWTGALAAIGGVAAITGLIYPLKTVATPVAMGVLYLIAVLAVASYWGLWMGLVTAVASGLAFNFFHIPPTGRLTIGHSDHAVAFAAYLASSAVAAVVADLARSRASEAERRREEADLGALLARTLLGEADLAAALPEASRQLSESLAMPVRLAVGSGEGIDLGRGATLVLPADVAPESLARIRARVVPSVAALVGAALDRDALQSEVVETSALRRSDVLKTTLLRAVSHDLRTPLTSIIASAHALASPSLEPEERADLQQSVVDEASRLSRLVDNLLDLSRLQAGAAAPHTDWCSVEDVVRTAAERVEDADIRLQLDADMPMVRADPAQLERVFVNLLENARRHGGGQPVTVKALVRPRRLIVRVVDQGPGLHWQLRDRIFEPFVQGDGSQGSGLGLAIVKGFVEVNGGTVRAESFPGQGAAFVVEFPLETP